MTARRSESLLSRSGDCLTRDNDIEKADKALISASHKDVDFKFKSIIDVSEVERKVTFFATLH